MVQTTSLTLASFGGIQRWHLSNYPAKHLPDLAIGSICKAVRFLRIQMPDICQYG
jgi:hypothetical protein